MSRRGPGLGRDSGVGELARIIGVFRGAGLTLLLSLGLWACGEAGPSGPSSKGPPELTELSPASGSPLESPLEVMLRGRRLSNAVVSGPPFVLLEVLDRKDTSIRLRVGFTGGPPGQHWLQVATSEGRDSLPFSVEPLAFGDSLNETRALWVSRFEYGSPDDLALIMEEAAQAGFNLVYLQVRGRADAYYSSAHEPWAANLTGVLGKNPGWDPLAVAVAEAGGRGLELHAWINAFTGWAGSAPPPPSQPLHAFLQHPEWVMVSQDGMEMPYQSGSRWLTPGHPGVRTRLARVASDIGRNYGVAGVHLDFIRYPGTNYSFDSFSLQAFDSARISEPGLGYDEMRRRFVTRAVSETRDSLDAVDPDLRLSAAVWGVFRNTLGWSGVSTGFDTVLQDAREWDRLGLVDALAPMVYWTMTPSYGDHLDFAFLADEHAREIEVPVFVGIYVPNLDGASLAQHVERARMAGAEGVSLFSFSALKETDLWGQLKTWAFYWPARRVDQ